MTSKSMKHRSDVRTQAEFERDICARTNKERFLARLFVMEMRERGSNIRIEELGNKDAGQVTADSNCEADYVICTIIDAGITKIPIDIKCCGIKTKATFKVYQLEQYVKQGASILLFLGTGFIDKDPAKINYDNTVWALIHPNDIQRMLDDLPHYKEKTFGYEMCVRVNERDFSKYFILNDLKVKNIEYSENMDLNLDK